MKKLLLLALIALSSTVGCREYNLYRYAPASTDVLGGNLTVALEGMYGQNYTNQGDKKADFGAPYTLQFRLSMPYEYNISGIEVKNIVVSGIDSQNTMSLPSVSSNKVRDPRKHNPDATDRTVSASIGNLTSDKLSYEPYRISATLVVIDDASNSSRQQHLSVSLNTDYKKERRSDWLDKHMGI